MVSQEQILRRVTIRPYREEMGPVFRLVVWDTYHTTHGKSCLGYRLQQIDPDGTRTTLFRGEDFGCSPLHCIDSRETIGAIMSFLTLQPGDTDAEYFAGYTPRQLEYCSQHAEALSAECRHRFGER
jgi:hypothetical protein